LLEGTKGKGGNGQRYQLKFVTPRQSISSNPSHPESVCPDLREKEIWTTSFCTTSTTNEHSQIEMFRG
jgi:hypothetical protein